MPRYPPILASCGQMTKRFQKVWSGVCRLILVCFVLYAVVCLALTLWQRHMIYVPPHFSADYVDYAAKKAHLERWRDASGQAVGMKWLSPRQPAVGRLLIVYGNGGWSIGCQHYAVDLQEAAPFDVFILEYPGYAGRVGAPSQASLFNAANDAMRLLGTNQPLYILGESLGTGVASYLAGAYPRQISGLILLSPYNRLTDVAQQRMPWIPVWLLLLDRFPSEDFLSHYHGPVGIAVDECDNVVPEKFGLRLYDGYLGPKRLWRFPDCGHITIGEPPAQFWTEVLAFWQTNRPAARYAGAANAVE